MVSWIVGTECICFIILIILFSEGSLFKRDLSIPSNLFRYKLLKLCIFIICFLPIGVAYVYSIPFILYYFISFMKDPELYNGRPSHFFFTLPFWKKIAKAKNSSVIKSCELKDNQYLFAAHPHGVLPFGICLNIGTNACDIDKLFPQIQFRGVAVSCCYIIPFYRDMCLALGGTDCRASTIRNCIHHGCSPLVVPGGAEESLLSHSHQNHILVKHKGFIRIAIEEGIPIVPMYSFGENNIWPIPKEKQPNQWINSITKRVFLGICLPPLQSILPQNTQITTVFGSPIPVQQNDHPSEEEINRIHSLYIEQIQALFKQYKPDYEEDLVIHYSLYVCFHK